MHSRLGTLQSHEFREEKGEGKGNGIGGEGKAEDEEGPI
jgi:hypothetical protein